MALANLFGWMKAEDKPATAACGTACVAGEKCFCYVMVKDIF